MARILTLVGLVAAGLTLAACETTDVNRAAIGGVGGALAAEALGGDPVRGAAIGVAGGIVCDDLTPGLCPN